MVAHLSPTTLTSDEQRVILAATAGHPRDHLVVSMALGTGLRHSSLTAIYRATHDLLLAQRFARHASPLTTTVYTHPGDEDMASRLRTLDC